MLIPYKFIPGTTAKANEVNANFVEVQKSVDALEQNQANLEVSVNNRANQNGDKEQVFNVAEANNQFGAVNLGQLLTFIAPLKGIVNGMVITVQENPSVLVSSGSCLDTSGEHIITATRTPLTLTATAPNTNMYIFATQSLMDNSFEYKITDNQYTIYNGYAQRLIGTYTCDTENKINSLNMIGTRVNAEEVINVVL